VRLSSHFAAIDGDQITHVFFDFAGTLVEGVPNWEYPQIVACAECGLVVSAAEVKAAIWRIWGPLEGCAHPEASVDEATYAQWIGEIERRILAALGVPGAALDVAVRRVTELQLAAPGHRIYPDVIPTLDCLRRRGLRLGLISNHAWQLPELVAALDLASYFDAIVTSARAGYRKPRHEIFQQALKLAGAEPGRSLYVGDDPSCDVVGARGAGLAALLVDRKDCAPLQDGRIRSLAELIKE
jgi:putative hydrolase of the HAD superfamily